MPDSEPWECIRTRTWEEFDAVVSKLPENRWLFRGQSDANWDINTSLFRAFEDAVPIIRHKTGTNRRFARDEHERSLVDSFKRSAHLYRSTLPKDDETLEWLAIMQHYGAPTRLLDVTLSPHIAAYFALDAGHTDAAIFAFNHEKLRPKNVPPESLRKKLFQKEASSESFIVTFRPRMTTERLVAQQGVFLVPSTNHESLRDLIEHMRTTASACKKIIVPEALRFDGIQRLRRMNLTSTALFPGIDGFCRSLRFQIFERIQTQRLLK